MTELPKYRMPVGVVTNQLELRQLQRQLLKQQYEKSRNRNLNSQQFGENKATLRRYSEKNLYNPQAITSTPVNSTKDDEFRNILAINLKQQIEQNDRKKRMQILKKLEQQKTANQRSKQQANRDFQTSKQIKQKIQFEMMKDYEQKLKRKQKDKEIERIQKQKIKNRLKNIEDLANREKKMKVHGSVGDQLSGSAKIPQYYKDVANYQQDNYRNFEQRVKSLMESQEHRLDNIIEQRILENKKKEQQFEDYQRRNKQNQREQLQRVLEEQIKQSEKRKQEQKAYEKSKFYGSKFENVYHPICNPVDSRFCKDNKYIIGELYQQGEKKSSRQSQILKRNNSGIGGIERDNGSVLARNGSMSLL